MKNMYAELAFSFKTVKLFKQNYYVLNNKSVTAGSLSFVFNKTEKKQQTCFGCSVWIS